MRVHGVVGGWQKSILLHKFRARVVQYHLFDCLRAAACDRSNFQETDVPRHLAVVDCTVVYNLQQYTVDCTILLADGAGAGTSTIICYADLCTA